METYIEKFIKNLIDEIKHSQTTLTFLNGEEVTFDTFKREKKNFDKIKDFNKIKAHWNKEYIFEEGKKNNYLYLANKSAMVTKKGGDNVMIAMGRIRGMEEIEELMEQKIDKKLLSKVENELFKKKFK